jgi:hypothetical protein
MLTGRSISPLIKDVKIQFSQTMAERMLHNTKAVGYCLCAIAIDRRRIDSIVILTLIIKVRSRYEWKTGTRRQVNYKH